MSVSPLAGQPAPASMLVDIPKLVTAYYADQPDTAVVAERVAFGTSGHRGSAFTRTFNESHILAITQSIRLYRQAHQITGPLFMGRDTHALSEPAFVSALEVLAANGVDVMIDRHDGYTPTPVISYAILEHNRGRTSGQAGGIVITPSHNPPEDGGFKYNPPHGGPAERSVTAWIEQTANALLADGFAGEENAGASLARTDVTPWTTDKDGIVLGLLAAEITARLGHDPGALYVELTRELGAPVYERIDAPATIAQRQRLAQLSPDQVDAKELAGDPIRAILTNAPGNGESIGGLKAITDNGWSAVRPSGTEDVYKLYAESFKDRAHLARIQDEVQELIARLFARPSSSPATSACGS